MVGTTKPPKTTRQTVFGLIGLSAIVAVTIAMCTGGP